MQWYERPELRFAVGLEDTFIPQARVGERALDEYELTQHYHHWHADLGLVADSGATMLRWGIPWYRVNPQPGVWDFSWLDRVVARLEELDVIPIVDLMHYGTPLWLDNGFLNDRYPEAVAEYARRVASRYRGSLEVFTALNEPLLNIMYCGEFAHWPPYLQGTDGFVKLLRAIGAGIVRTQEEIRRVNATASFVHVEASFRFDGDGDGRTRRKLDHLRERAFVVGDLITGQMMGDHPLLPYLRGAGFTEADEAWFRDRQVVPDVMGVNYYPQLSTELLTADDHHSGGPRDPRPRIEGGTAGLEDVLSSYAQRYGRPVFLTETCWFGSVDARIEWLDASVACVRRLRDRGVDVVGYTWWPLFDMIDWDYRFGTEPPESYRLPMGLWDLQLDAAGVYQRVRNRVADRFHQHATARSAAGGGRQQ